jgi:hypothetical protein
MDIKDIIYWEEASLDEDTVGVTLHTEGINRPKVASLVEQWRELVESNHGYSRAIRDAHEELVDLFGKFRSPEDASRFLAANNRWYTHPSAK